MRISCELEGILWTWPENPAWSLFNWTLGVAWVSTVYDVEIGYIFKEIRHNFKNRSLMEKKCMYKYFSCKGYVTVKKIASRWNDTKMRKRKWKTYQCMFFCTLSDSSSEFWHCMGPCNVLKWEEGAQVSPWCTNWM